jgi:hypothetical protein
MLNERVLRDGDGLIGFDQVLQSFVGQVEVQSIGVVEVVLADIDLSFINVWIRKEGLL